MTSEIDKLKHFHVENYSGTNFTDDLNDGEEFLYTTIRCKDDKEVTLLCKYVKNKPLINKKVLAKVIRESNICKHAIKELKLAGYGNGEGGPNDWMYQQVIELTGRYFNQCHLLPYKINKGWTPRPTITIDCVEIEIAPDNYIMAVDANNTNLLLLNAYYNIQWKECSCLRGIRLEDVTVELEKEAYEEMRHN
ncbi:MAG: hypothetical protein [Bacteriophage sp.]|nr:MAG: hypothetical protein [Bacteriophage sp.]